MFEKKKKKKKGRVFASQPIFHTLLQQKIALFAAPMREQTGNAPGFLEKLVSQFIFQNV